MLQLSPAAMPTGIQEHFRQMPKFLSAVSDALSSAEFVYYLRSYLLVIVIAIIGATPLPKKIVEKIREKETGNKVINLIEPAVCIILFVMITAYLVDGSFNPFLYFRF